MTPFAMWKKIKKVPGLCREFYRDPRDFLGAYCSKDLMQSLNNPWFIWSFSGMHVLTGLMLVCLYFIEQQGDLNRFNSELVMGILSGILICLLCLIFGIFQPLSAIFNMRQEFTNKRFELLVLSSCKSSQISWGKYKSFALQNLLILFSLLPYIGLVYFNSDISFTELLLTVFISLLVMQALICLGLGMGCCKTFMGKLFYLFCGGVIGAITINITATIFSAVFVMIPGSRLSSHMGVIALTGTLIGYTVMIIMNMSWINSKLSNQLVNN